MKLNTLLIIAVASLSAACNDDNQTPVTGTPISIGFEQTAMTFAENSGTTTINLPLGRPAPANGYVVIEVNNPNVNAITTDPVINDRKLTLPILSGSSSTSFAITPVNNQILDGTKTLTFTIKSVSAGLSIGTGKSITITITDDEQAVRVDFLTTESIIREDGSSDGRITIALSAPATATGQLAISLLSEDAVYGEDYTSIPPAIKGIVTLAVTPGAEQMEMHIVPIDNTRIGGTKHVAAIMTEATGVVTLGTKTGHGVTIKDDELDGVSKSYATGGGQWGQRKYFVYDAQGRIAKVLWEQYTPAYTGGSYSYQYDGAQLSKMISSDGSETIYTTVSGQIVKSEKFKDGILKQTKVYGYDPAGNVGEMAVFDRQPSGEMAMSLIFVYLYFTDGNLYKQLTYNPNGEDEPVLISTRTYEHYLPQENPFAMVDILPNVITQRNLPGMYRVEENGFDITYTMNYEFDSNGRVRKRTAASSAGTDVTVYNFY